MDLKLKNDNERKIRLLKHCGKLLSKLTTRSQTIFQQIVFDTISIASIVLNPSLANFMML
jgi:hypothetical protein